MNIVSFIYNEVLFRPLYNLLVVVTNVLPGHNVGISILLLTILVRLILLPPSWHQAKQMQRNQSKMSALKQELNKIQEKYKNDKVKKAEETAQLYKKAGINPASGCLPLLIQLPILIALYRVFFVGIGEQTYRFLYGFVSRPDVAQMGLLGIDLAKTSVLLAVMSGVFQFVLMRMASPAPTMAPAGDDQSAQMMASMQKNMSYMFPVMTVFIAIKLPAALSLYWVATTLFGIGQQYLFKKYLKVSGTMAV